MKKEQNYFLRSSLNQCHEGLFHEQYLLEKENTAEEFDLRNSKFFFGLRCIEEKGKLKNEFVKRMIFNQYDSLRQFKENESKLEVWRQKGGIKRVYEVLRSEQKDQELIYQVIGCLETIISLEIDSGFQQISLEDVFYQDILLLILQYWRGSRIKQRNVHLQRLIDYLLLRDFQNQIILQGGFSFIVDSTLTKIKHSQLQISQINQLIQFSSLLATYLNNSSSIKLQIKLYYVLYLFKCKYDLILSLFNELIIIDYYSSSQKIANEKIHSQQIVYNSPQQSIDKKCLQILYIIFDTQQEQLYLTFTKYQSLFFMILKLLLNEQMSIKKKAWTIIALLSSSQFQKIQSLFQQVSFFDLLVKSEKSILREDNNFEYFNFVRQKIVLCIGNLAEYGDHMIKQILNPQIIKILIGSILQTNSHKLKTNSYFALINIIFTSNPTLLSQIINEYPIPDLLVNGLITQTQNHKIMSEILSALQYLIQKDQQLHQDKPQTLSNILENKYSLSTLLQITQQNFEKLQSF